MEVRQEQEDEVRNEKQVINDVCELIDQRFKDLLHKFESGFVRLNCPLLSNNECRFIHNVLKTKLKNTYLNIQQSLGTDDEFRILMNWIIQKRQSNQLCLTHFGRMMAYAEDAEGGCGIMGDVTRYFRIQVSKSTLY